MRPLIFGNGRILVCEDERGTIRDIYYPYVGLENHCNFIRAGICDLDESLCSWLKDWRVDQRYISSLEDSNSLSQTDGGVEGREVHSPSNIGETKFSRSDWGIEITSWDAVHPSSRYFYRVFEVRNVSSSTKNLRLFSNQNYNILENNIGETAVVDRDLLIHYKRNRYFLHASRPKFDQFATGIAEWRGLQGTWRDMEEDGNLSGNIVAHGSVDSTVGWTIPDLLPKSSKRIDMWIVIGDSYTNVIRIHKKIAESSSTNVYHQSFNFWRSFIERISSQPQWRGLGELPGVVRSVFYRSLLATVAHMDVNGSVIASGDSEIKQLGADLYTYCWPRDAAWACLALDHALYHHLTSEVYDFLSRVITRRGYLLHKYTPAGDFGSTWHPVPMIQIDETGLPLYALYNNWQISRDVWIAGRYFSSLVAPAADYLTGTLNQRTGLPAPSYDLWEERRGVHTYSACTVYAGLKGASHLARVMGADLEEERWLKAALRVKSAIPDLLYDHSLGHFKRSLTDSTLDSSAFAVWYFGVLPPDDEMVVNTTREIENQLKRPSGGFARYKNDSYQGYMNSWIICTLWLAQWHIATGNLSRAMDLIRWCAEHAHPAGLMPEQVGEDGSPGSVLPLMWSHCAFVLAVLEYLEAIESRALDHQKLLESPEC